MSYKPLKEGLFVSDSPIEGQGLFTRIAINKDEYLGSTHVETKDLGVLRINGGGFINHSDEPNCKITKNRLDGYGMLYVWNLFPIRDIEPGEELTLKYQYFNKFKDEL